MKVKQFLVTVQINTYLFYFLSSSSFLVFFYRKKIVDIFKLLFFRHEIPDLLRRRGGNALHHGRRAAWRVGSRPRFERDKEWQVSFSTSRFLCPRCMNHRKKHGLSISPLSSIGPLSGMSMFQPRSRTNTLQQTKPSKLSFLPRSNHERTFFAHPLDSDNLSYYFSQFVF